MPTAQSAAAKAALAAQVEREHARILESFAAEMTSTVRIISGRDDVFVKFLQRGAFQPGSPAYTDGTNISLSEKMGREVLNRGLVKFVLVFKGTVYHENAHNMLTPRYKDKIKVMLRQKCMEAGSEGVYGAFMMLEDQRIEMMYTTEFAGTTPYFVLSATQWLVEQVRQANTPDERKLLNESIWPLIHGRRFMADETRDAARSAFESAHGLSLTVELAQIIEDYQQVVFPLDTIKAYDLILRFNKLLPHPPVSEHTTVCGIGHKGMGNDTITDGETIIEAQNDAAEKIQAEIQDAEDAAHESVENDDAEADPVKGDADAEDTEDDTDEDGADGGSGGGESGDDDAEGDGGDGDEGTDGDGDDSAGEGDGEGDGGTPGDEEAGEDVSDSEGGGTGSTGGQDGKEQFQDLADAAEDALTDARLDESIQTDVNQTVKAVNHRVHSAAIHEAPEPRPVVNGDENTTLVSNQIVTELRQLKIDMEPTWLHRQSTGRANIRKMVARRANPGDIDVFDRWDEGAEEDAGTEVAILLDQSGSMSGDINKASQVLWCLKRAFDRTDITCSVLGFSSSTKVLYRPQDKAEAQGMPRFGTHGSTYPLDALQRAFGLLERSEKKNLLFICITDGVWSSTIEADTTIAEMKRRGITTAIFGLGSDLLRQTGDHGCDIAHNSPKIEDLTKFVKDIVVAVHEKVRDTQRRL